MERSRVNEGKRAIIKLIDIMNVIILILIFGTADASAFTPGSREEISNYINQIFENRNRGIISGDLELIESIYDLDTKYGLWACEYEKRKMKYIQTWEYRQGARFVEINPKIVIKSIRVNGDTARVSLVCSTEYKYEYIDQPRIINKFKIGTQHFLQLKKENDLWIIWKEWYKDPFADSLNINDEKADDIRKFILSQNSRDIYNIEKNRIRTAEYLNKYCGVAYGEENEFKYNKKYINYNPQGGDCANFASQALHEGGKFRKTHAWNYDNGDVTRAWVNADGFKDYMIRSGRASIIANGSYEKIYKFSYKLLPGDFVAYEKKGDITHISMVSGADSRGYSLVSCHNTDRNNVPWDLGWGDKSIRFWLVRVHF